MLIFEVSVKKNRKILGSLTNYYEFWETNSKQFNNETKVQWTLSTVCSTNGATNLCAGKICFWNRF